MALGKFRIGQSVRLRRTVGDYRIVSQLPQTGNVVRYRVRSSADENDEVVVKESELHG